MMSEHFNSVSSPRAGPSGIIKGPRGIKAPFSRPTKLPRRRLLIPLNRRSNGAYPFPLADILFNIPFQIRGHSAAPAKVRILGPHVGIPITQV